MELINKALCDRDDVLKFNVRSLADSTLRDVSDGEEVEVETISIDNVLNGEKATIIKLDIKGAEHDALIGAKNTILKYKPRLLIAGYHLPNDCIDLINLVTSFRDDYKIYIRQYNYNKHETVIYFV